MEQIMETRNYQEFKRELDGEMSRAAESFVRIGYLLKLARDTDVLRESGYPNVVEFAKAEYGIDKTQVSRFIHINDRFSEGGYGASLMQQYQGYGYAKLTIMLQLADEINEELTPEYTKAEIQAIKDEADAEARTTEIEHMLEEVPEQIAEEASTLKRILISLGEAEPELYRDIHLQAEHAGWEVERLKDDMAPEGEHSYSVRVPGEGRYLLILAEERATYTNMRTMEKQECTWEEIMEAWGSIMHMEREAESDWSFVYGRPFPKPEKSEVAPVQRKENKVTKAKDPKPAIKPSQKAEQEPKAGQAETEEIPGRTNIEDFPEYMPEPEEGAGQPEESTGQQSDGATEQQSDGATEQQSDGATAQQSDGPMEQQSAEDVDALKDRRESLARAISVDLISLEECVKDEDWSAVETMAHTIESVAKKLQEVEQRIEAVENA